MQRATRHLRAFTTLNGRGEHTREVPRQELAMSEEEIAALEREKEPPYAAPPLSSPGKPGRHPRVHPGNPSTFFARMPRWISFDPP